VIDFLAMRGGGREGLAEAVKDSASDLLRKEKCHRKISRRMEGRDVVKVLVKNFGFSYPRTNGSHAILCKSSSEKGKPSCRVVVPLHETIKVGTLKGIINEVSNQAHIPIETLIEQLG